MSFAQDGFMRARTRVTAAATALAMAVTLSACGSSKSDLSDDDGAGDVATVAPATPAGSPPQAAQLPGTVIPAAPGTALAQAGSTLAILGTDGTVTLHTAPGAQDTPPPRPVDLPTTTALIADGDGFLAAAPGQIVRITPGGAVTRVAEVKGHVLSLAVANDGRILAGTDDGRLLVLARDGKVQRDIHKFVRVDQILVAPKGSGVAGQVSVIDRAQSSITPVGIDDGDIKAALRAGNGVTDAVVDRYGRVVASNTRDDELLGFYGAPIVMRFRFPVAPSPYALAYDESANLLWVSTTGNNAAIAYDLATGEPRERARIGTVGQVGALAVDAGSGMLYLISARGDGLQVVPRSAVDTHG